MNKRSDRTTRTNEVIEQLEHSKSSGFTLVEVLVASMIFAVTIAMAIATFASSSTVQNQNQVIREVSQTGRYIIEAIARDVRLAADDLGTDDLDPFVLNDTSDVLTVNTINEEGMTTTVTYTFEPSDTANETPGTIIYNGINMTNENVTIEPIDGATIFQEGVYESTIGEDGEIQPTLQIKFKISTFKAGKISEKTSQIFQTTVTSRSYPGFNPE